MNAVTITGPLHHLHKNTTLWPHKPCKVLRNTLELAITFYIIHLQANVSRIGQLTYVVLKGPTMGPIGASNCCSQALHCFLRTQSVPDDMENAGSVARHDFQPAAQLDPAASRLYEGGTWAN